MLVTSLTARRTLHAAALSPAARLHGLRSSPSPYRLSDVGGGGARRPLFVKPSPILLAANPQSGKPASDNAAHMIRNIKEESRGVRESLESAVSGGQSSELISDAKSVIGEMTQRVPQPALLWGAAGVIPYISTAGASVYLSRQAQLVAQGFDSSIDLETASALLLHAENVQITFGAVLLSFLGAIHWGFEFSKYGGEIGNRRYALGLIPVAIAWPTLMLAPQMALVCQWAGFVATWFIDLRTTTFGWAPKWYSSYRFGLTLVVGTSILATLAGTNYYNVDQSVSSAGGVGRRLKKATAQAAERAGDSVERLEQGIRSTPELVSKVAGDVQAEKSDDDSGFVKVSNPKRKEEERKQKEEEEKKKKEEEAKKKKEEDSKKKDDGEAKEDKGDKTKEDKGDKAKKEEKSDEEE